MLQTLHWLSRGDTVCIILEQTILLDTACGSNVTVLPYSRRVYQIKVAWAFILKRSPFLVRKVAFIVTLKQTRTFHRIHLILVYVSKKEKTNNNKNPISADRCWQGQRAFSDQSKIIFFKTPEDRLQRLHSMDFIAFVLCPVTLSMTLVESRCANTIFFHRCGDDIHVYVRQPSDLNM